MADREKVINGLEHCDFGVSGACYEKECPYYQSDCTEELKNDILILLKEQEPREPHYTTLRYLVNGMEVAIQLPECPRCIENGLVLWDAELEKGQAYCKRCGQAVKWDD
jgi:uncharacterized Fe-S cluster-containing protein